MYGELMHLFLDDDVVVVAPPPPKISRPSTPPPPSISKTKDVETDSRSYQSLSIEETNKLRARLGLKPLTVDAPTPENGSKDVSQDQKEDGVKVISADMEEFIHKPAG